jgi:hypothetical protein
MDAMQRLDRAIKMLVVIITLAALALVGVRVMASKSLRVDPRAECLTAGRQWNAATRVCLPR